MRRLQCSMPNYNSDNFPLDSRKWLSHFLAPSRVSVYRKNDGFTSFSSIFPKTMSNVFDILINQVHLKGGERNTKRQKLYPVKQP